MTKFFWTRLSSETNPDVKLKLGEANLSSATRRQKLNWKPKAAFLPNWRKSKYVDGINHFCPTNSSLIVIDQCFAANWKTSNEDRKRQLLFLIEIFENKINLISKVQIKIFSKNSLMLIFRVRFNFWQKIIMEMLKLVSSLES